MASFQNQQRKSLFLSKSALPIAKKSRKAALFYSDCKVFSKSGRTSTVPWVIQHNTITVLFFGSHVCQKSQVMVERLKSLVESSLDFNVRLAVVYIPLYTYVERRPEVESDFLRRHGDWWALRFQSWEALEATLMHGVTVVPSLVVVDNEGTIISECGQNDMDIHGNDVILTWS